MILFIYFIKYIGSHDFKVLNIQINLYYDLSCSSFKFKTKKARKIYFILFINIQLAI